MLYILTHIEKLPIVLQFATKEDELLLTQSSVYMANPNHFLHTQLQSLPCPISVLNIDLQARGIDSYVSPKISVIDMDNFVDLTAKHSKSISW
ncbi:sulfurtransferase complex subunit TusB [Vibrio sp. ZSDE26]|uniref:Sulfurtransferase complex subunit TusB n=1 Tax=Vibrio amylolyticus TaxID=2847292 RepID=A0A9X1XTB6_9VIBR|nr:sulfurtransferase complex subunit TusB [Vibrio amylolyticus]MCK6265224.1 sulfurtransferase complex subunit TusB [Vibrio amylolyticus]